MRLKTLAPGNLSAKDEIEKAPLETASVAMESLFTRLGASDESAELAAHYESVTHDAGRLPEQAFEHIVVIVPGFTYDYHRDTKREYFAQGLRRLQELGIEAAIVPTLPHAPSEANAQIINKIISQSNKPVVLIGHSKGGIDANKALESSSHGVSRLVTLQSPYNGSSPARWSTSWPGIHLMLGTMLIKAADPAQFLKYGLFAPLVSTVQNLEILSTTAQLARGAAGAPRHSVPVYSIATRVNTSDSLPMILSGALTAVRWITREDNDGTVAVSEAIVPGSRAAVLDNISHLDPALGPNSRFGRHLNARNLQPNFGADLTEAIIRWIFAR